MPNQFSQWMQRDGYPLTKAILLLNVVTLFVVPVASALDFMGPAQLSSPWRLVTYPLVSYDPIYLICYALWVWSVCGSLERSWGTPIFARFYTVITIFAALALSAGGAMYKVNVPVGGDVALTAILAGWATLEPNEPMCVWFVSIQRKWIAVVGAAIILWQYLHFNLVIGALSLFGCGLSYFWTSRRGWRDSFSYAYRAPLPRVKKPKPGKRDDDFTLKSLNPIERYQRAKRKKQFQRLFEDDDK